MSVCVCVRPQAIKNYSCEMKSQTSPIAFQFLCTALAIDIVDGRGLSYEVHCVLLKKSKVMLYLHSKSPLTSCTLLIRWSTLVKWACHAGCEAYKRRLAYSATVRISA